MRSRREVVREVLLGAAVLLSVACSGAQTTGQRRGPITAGDYFPLRTGAAWSYDTRTGYGGDTVLSTLAVVGGEGTSFQVRSGTRTERYERRPDGIVREGDYILRDPIRAGASWDARDGGRFEVRALNLTRRVGEREFRHVIEVVRASPVTRILTTTWYARDVGVIEIQAETSSTVGGATGTIGVRSTLRSFTLGDE